MRELNKTSSDLRFYHSKFPMCEGVMESDWKYEYHKNFELDADYRAEYVLHVNDNQVQGGHLGCDTPPVDYKTKIAF